MHLSAYIEVSPDGEKCRMADRQWVPFVLPGAVSHTPSHQQLSDTQHGAIDPNFSLSTEQIIRHSPLVPVGAQAAAPANGYAVDPSGHTRPSEDPSVVA